MTKKSNNNGNKNNGMNNNETKLVCPNCGAEFEIGEHECNVKNATVVGADSGLGTIYLKLKDRQEQLNKAGIDTSKYFSMTTPGGIEKLMMWDGDTPVAVTPDDPIFKSIMDQGTIPNRDLFRRWVMAQVFQGLSYKGYNGDNGFTEWVHHKGYRYTFDMVEEELRVQAKLYEKDMENYNERNRWFNRDVAVAMIDDYINKLKNVIKGKKLHKCKGVPYICIGGKNVFVVDIEHKVIWPLNRIKLEIKGAKTPKELYEKFHVFNRRKIGLKWNTMCSSVWLSAYKGAGAFYSMKNMIMFHNCKLRSGDGRWLSEKASLLLLHKKAEEYKNEGWKLFGFMRKMMDDNKIDIKKKQEEWRKEKQLNKK